MAFPSSPPLLPDINTPGEDVGQLQDETGELQFHLSEKILPLAQQAFQYGRKRPLSDYNSQSSDPVFSDEPSEADVGDYDSTRSRPKRWLRGPWFNLRKESQLRMRRGMDKQDKIRNADSGVWMGSDASEGSIGSVPCSQERIVQSVFDDELDGHRASQSVELASNTTVTPDSAACAVIDICLEQGNEVVDLSGIGLTDLHNETIGRLHQLIRRPPFETDRGPDENQYRGLTPSIQLFLFGNELSTLPSALFTLTNITVLSLRNNRLTRIPPAIGRLHKLQEMNLAQNNLRFLPWEVLGLVQLRDRQIRLRPNPFVVPAEIPQRPMSSRPSSTTNEVVMEWLSKWVQNDDEHHQKIREWYRRDGVSWGPWEEMYIRMKLGHSRQNDHVQEATRLGKSVQTHDESSFFLVPSYVRFFNVDGAPLRSGPFTPTPGDDFTANFDETSSQPFSGRACGVPSLFELSLRSVLSTRTSVGLGGEASCVPPRVLPVLESVTTGDYLGDETCTTCGRPFIIARAEWIEYWFNGSPSVERLTQDDILPFMRRACSWRCAVPSELGAFRC